MKEFLYDLFRVVGVITGYPIQWVLFKRKVYYQEGAVKLRHIRGGSLLISNHYSPFDYVSDVFLVFPRKLYVVASEDAFRNRWITFGMKFWGGIQANRVTKSPRFIIESVHKLKEGKIVLIFPEGHNTDDGTIKAFYPSYLAIALRADVPLVPLVTDGGYGLFKRLHVYVGKPLYLRDLLPPSSDRYTREDIDRLNVIVREKMLAMHRELYRLTGKPQPQGKDRPQ